MYNRLGEVRTLKGWSQKQLSLYSGVNTTTISNIENNVTLKPSVVTALRLSKALQVKVEDIFILN